MKARNFRYIRPSSLDQACRILAEGGGAAVPVAGGQSLLAGLNMRLSAPKLLVDIGDLKELTGQSYEEGAVRLGALTRHAELLGSQVIQKHVPLLVRAAAATCPMCDPQSRHLEWPWDSPSCRAASARRLHSAASSANATAQAGSSAAGSA
jgi:CO/xanthine dehydrogenase FAD-binding subunit